MNKLFFYISFIITLSNCLLAQNKIYNALDNFVANPTLIEINKFQHFLDKFERENQNNNQLLALAIAHSNLAFYQSKFDLPKKAIESYFKAEEIILKNNLKGYDLSNNITLPLAKLLLKKGKYNQAETKANQVLKIANIKKDTLKALNASIILSNVYYTNGNYKTALKILDKAQIISKNQPNLYSQITTNIISNQIALGNLKDAESTLKKLSKEQRNSNFYKTFALLKVKQNQLTTASLYFEKAKQQLLIENPNNRTIAISYIEEAQLWLTQKMENKTIALLDKATSILFPKKELRKISQNDIYNDPLLIELFNTYSEVYPKESLFFIKLSLEVYNKQLIETPSLKTKISFQSSRKLIIEKAIENFYQKYSSSKDSIIAISAFSFIENSKANQLSNSISKKKLLSLHPNDKRLFEEQKLVLRRQKLSKKIKDQTGIDTNSIIELNKVNQQIIAIQKQLKKIYPKSYDYQLDTSHFLKKINSKNASCISFFFGKKHLYWIHIGDFIDFKQIEISENFNYLLKNYIHQFDNASIINNNVYNFSKSAFQLFKAFDLPKTKNKLLIIPDGILNFVPFEALLTEEIKTTNFNKMPFLVKGKTIVYSNNAHLYLIKKSTPIQKNKKVLGFFPVFKNSTSYSELKYSIDEAKSISENFETKQLYEKDASISSFLKKANQFDILHLCTHAKGGTFNQDGIIQFYDKFLKISELEKIKLKNDLVILSACETGIGKITKAQAPESIANSFQKTGVENLIYSLWEINDLSTSLIMKSFYKNLYNTQSISEANRFSKIEYLENPEISNLRKSPYYWSSFVYYGDFEEPNTNQFTLTLYFLFSFILITLSYFLYKKKIKK